MAGRLYPTSMHVGSWKVSFQLSSSNTEQETRKRDLTLKRMSPSRALIAVLPSTATHQLYSDTASPFSVPDDVDVLGMGPR